jgi:dipeptidase E
VPREAEDGILLAVPSQIIAIGGGRTDPAVRDHILAASGRSSPRVLYIGTASAEDPRSALRTIDLFGERAAKVSRLEFFPWPPRDLEDVVLSHHVVFVGGGNTVNMLAIWRAHGLDRVLERAWRDGVVLAGSSAGMICWFEAGTTDSFGPQLDGLRDGLRILPGSACPHYDDEPNRRPLYRRLVEEDGFPPGYAADSGVGLHFVGRELAEVVTPREGATAYRVDEDGERPLEARLLRPAG